METIKLTEEWDKVFAKSEKVNHEKATFHNRYGITLACDVYSPKNAKEKLPAIAVCGPFGAVKEQASGLYAQSLAERGFLTIAFDPSFTGESGGEPRYVASPDINTEDFCAAVDFLSCHEKVDPERIGILGICGWGGMALNAAAMDTRIKGTVASTMYDMTRVNAKGYFDSEDSADARFAKKQAMNAQRTMDYKSGTYQRAGGVVDPLPDDAPFFVKDYYDYTRPSAAIMLDPSIRTMDGTRPRRSPFSICPYSPMRTRSRAQCFSFTAKRRTRVIFRRTHSERSRERTRSFSSFPAQYTPISMTAAAKTPFPSRRLWRSIIPISDNAAALRRS